MAGNLDVDTCGHKIMPTSLFMCWWHTPIWIWAKIGDGKVLYWHVTNMLVTFLAKPFGSYFLGKHTGAYMGVRTQKALWLDEKLDNGRNPSMMALHLTSCRCPTQTLDTGSLVIPSPCKVCHCLVQFCRWGKNSAGEARTSTLSNRGGDVRILNTVAYCSDCSKCLINEASGAGGDVIERN